jgi:hypothetical protein
MQQMIEVTYEPLRRIARRFHLGFRAAWGLALALAVALVGAMLLRPEATGAWLAGLTGHPLVPRPWQGLALAGIALGALGTYAATFAAATRVCHLMARGDLAAAGPAARRLSHWLWGVLALSVAANTLAVLVVTAHAGPGQRALSFAIGSPQVSIAVAAAIAAFLAHALTLGAALWQDHREIV